MRWCGVDGGGGSQGGERTEGKASLCAAPRVTFYFLQLSSLLLSSPGEWPLLEDTTVYFCADLGKAPPYGCQNHAGIGLRKSWSLSSDFFKMYWGLPVFPFLPWVLHT